MSLKKSKKVRVLRRRGLIFFLSHCIKTCLKTKRKYGILGYIVNFMERKCEKRLKSSKYKFKILFSFYPKLTLTKSQYKTFKLANKHFNENYKNIIAISPLFFIKNLKKHITWIESKEFKNVYGNITDLSNIQLNTIEANLKENSLLKTTMIAPPPHSINSINKTDNLNNSNTINNPTASNNANTTSNQNQTESTFTKQSTHKENNAMSALQTTKQFYPPLLNPKEVDYSTIDSNIALELRLPPKANYKFVFIRYGLSGGAAMSDFLPNSNIIEADYKQCLKIQKSQDNICFYINHLWRREEAYLNKTLCTLKPNDSILILVRDPISRIKTACNHGWFKHGRNYDHIVKFGITDDIYKVIDSIGFYNEDGKLISNHAFAYNSFIDYIIGLSSFAYYSNIAPLFKDSNITYLDMQEIMPDKAFDTMTRLAKKFNFTLPNEKDKDFYTAIRFNEMSYILPLVCVIDLNNNQKVKIHIVSKQQEKQDSININRILFTTPNPLLDKVSFNINESDLKALQEDKETLSKVKSYMQDFLIELQKRTDYIKRNKKHENDVLEIFRGDKDLCKKFKTMLDKELIHIKTHRPDIVASWKYYQEFEKICKEVGI